MAFHWIVIEGFALLFVLAWIYRKQILKQVTYERRFSRSTAFEGERIEMVESIANRKALPIPWLRLESVMSRDLVFSRQANFEVNSGEKFQNHLSLFSLRSYRQIVRRHDVLCLKRGSYMLNSVTMTAGEPFGLVQVFRHFPLSLELLVFPRPLPLQGLPLPSHSWLGNLAVRRWIVEDPFLASGIREYRAGDSFRSINWKASARTGSMQVHKRDFTSDHRLVICLNVEVTSTMWNSVTQPERIELGIRYAATAADYALANGIDTGLLSNGWLQGEAKQPVRLSPQGGSLQQETLLTALAKLQLETASNMVYLLDQEADTAVSRCDYLLITCHRDDKLVQAAERLRKRGHGVEWLDIPAKTGGGHDESRPDEHWTRQA